MGRKKGVPHPPGCGHCSPESRARAGAKQRGVPAPQRGRTGEGNSAWKPEADPAGYGAGHRLVTQTHGRAALHRCVDCGEPADEWSNLSGDFRNVDDYVPRCVGCHRAHDIGGRKHAPDCKHCEAVRHPRKTTG